MIGPNGGFVVVATTSSGRGPLAGAARHAGGLAGEARTSLASLVGMAPFLDALVVSTGRRRSGIEAACVVPLDLLHQVLVEGPRVVAADLLDRLDALVTGGDLPGWHPGTPRGSDVIDLDQAPAQHPDATVPTT